MNEQELAEAKMIAILELATSSAAGPGGGLTDQVLRQISQIIEMKDIQ